MKMITEAAEDPDTDIAEWLAGERPLGRERPIESGGTFPGCTEIEVRAEEVAGRRPLRMDRKLGVSPPQAAQGTGNQIGRLGG